MSKKLETRWAEVIFVVLITIVLMSSCSSYTLCDAYAGVEVENELK